MGTKRSLGSSDLDDPSTHPVAVGQRRLDRELAQAIHAKAPFEPGPLSTLSGQSPEVRYRPTTDIPTSTTSALQIRHLRLPSRNGGSAAPAVQRRKGAAVQEWDLTKYRKQDAVVSRS